PRASEDVSQHRTSDSRRGADFSPHYCARTSVERSDLGGWNCSNCGSNWCNSGSWTAETPGVQCLARFFPSRKQLSAATIAPVMCGFLCGHVVPTNKQSDSRRISERSRSGIVCRRYKAYPGLLLPNMALLHRNGAGPDGSMGCVVGKYEISLIKLGANHGDHKHWKRPHCGEPESVGDKND